MVDIVGDGDVDENEVGDSDEVADAGNLMGSDIGLVVCNAHSNDCTMFGDCGADGGDRSNFRDGENIVGSGELEGDMSGLGVCEDESEIVRDSGTVGMTGATRMTSAMVSSKVASVGLELARASQ